MSSTENQQKEAKVGADESDLDGDCQHQECGRVRLLLFFFSFLGKDANYYVNGELTACDKEYEADDSEIGEESPCNGHQIQVSNLDRLVNLLDQSGLEED